MKHSRITEHIWCGGALHPGDWERLYNEGVRIDLSLQVEARDDFAALNPEAELWLPTVDCHMPSMDQLALAAQFIGVAVGLRKGVVVHCMHGIGRAPMTLACHFVAEGMTAREAAEFVRARRAIVQPNRGQFAVVEEFERLHRVVPFRRS